MDGWTRITVVLALLLPGQAHASGLACGQYRAVDPDSSQVLVIGNARQGSPGHRAPPRH